MERDSNQGKYDRPASCRPERGRSCAVKTICGARPQFSNAENGNPILIMVESLASRACNAKA